MITFFICLFVMLMGYCFYSKYIDKAFGIDSDRVTPAITKRDNVDYMPLPTWKVFMIHFLNIAGCGPIFGGILGAKYGPMACVWIAIGCTFAGGTYDYLSGMISLRKDGVSLPDIIARYLGLGIRTTAIIILLILLLLVGAVFTYTPAMTLHSVGGSLNFWIAIITGYYVIATLLPIDKIIGRLYPILSITLVFMTLSILICLIVKMPAVPEIWNHLTNMMPEQVAMKSDPMWPTLCIIIACGAISGFHATQSPIMARCMKNERDGRKIFYGAMILEGLVGMIWATVGMYFFYNKPIPGYEEIGGLTSDMFSTAPYVVVKYVCYKWLGPVGGLLAVMGVISAVISTGDTAFRGARLIIADSLKINQRSIKNRLAISLPLFLGSIILVLWQITVPDSFNKIWQHFSYCNQLLAFITLLALSVFMVKHRKNYWVVLIPTIFMLDVCVTYTMVSPLMLNLPTDMGYLIGTVISIISLIAFLLWRKHYIKKESMD